MEASEFDIPRVSSDSGRSVNLHRYLAAFRRRALVFSLVAIIILLLVAAITFYITPTYSAIAEVMLDARTQKIVDVQEVMSGLPADTSMVDTEVEVLQSRGLTERVVSQLHMDSLPEFNRGNGGADPVTAHERVVDAVQHNLSIARSGLTYVIRITFKSKNAKLAATVANTYATLYTTSQVQQKFEANAQATKFLTARVNELRQQVESTDAALQRYKAANGLLSAQGNTLTENDISNLGEQLASTRAAEAEEVARYSTAQKQLAGGSNGEDVGASLDSPVVQQLRNQRAQISRQVADLEQRYGARYPELLRAKRQLADVDQQIQIEIKRIISNLSARAQVARQRTASIEGSLGQARGRLAANNNASVEKNELERRADSVRTLYQTFLDRLHQTTAQQGLQESDSEILSRAKIPTRPSSPNLLLNLILGLLAGIVAGSGVIILLELLDDRLATASDIEQEFNLPALPSIPDLKSTVARGQSAGAPGDYIVTAPLSSFAEAFRNLRAALLSDRQRSTPKIVAITSTLPHEGKTTIVLCLGRIIAQAGSSVVMVDCDLRRARLSEISGHRREGAGLVELLNGQSSLEEALVRDELSGAWILPVTQAGPGAEEIWGSERVDKLFAELRQKFDVVLLDTSPVLAIADALIVSQKADAVLLVAKWRKTSRNAVRSSLKALDSVGVHVAGISLSIVDMREQAKSGYGDPGYFSNLYSSYYSQ
jgi:capsular exopolysaccharide synthesis family protein